MFVYNFVFHWCWTQQATSALLPNTDPPVDVDFLSLLTDNQADQLMSTGEGSPFSAASYSSTTSPYSSTGEAGSPTSIHSVHSSSDSRGNPMSAGQSSATMQAPTPLDLLTGGPAAQAGLMAGADVALLQAAQSIPALGLDRQPQAAGVEGLPANFGLSSLQMQVQAGASDIAIDLDSALLDNDDLLGYDDGLEGGDAPSESGETTNVSSKQFFWHAHLMFAEEISPIPLCACKPPQNLFQRDNNSSFPVQNSFRQKGAQRALHGCVQYRPTYYLHSDALHSPLSSSDEMKWQMSLVHFFFFRSSVILSSLLILTAEVAFFSCLVVNRVPVFFFQNLVLTEEEKRLLAQDGIELPTDLPLTKVRLLIFRKFWQNSTCLEILWLRFSAVALSAGINPLW